MQLFLFDTIYPCFVQVLVSEFAGELSNFFFNGNLVVKTRNRIYDNYLIFVGIPNIIG